MRKPKRRTAQEMVPHACLIRHLVFCTAEDLPDQPLIGGRGRIVDALSPVKADDEIQKLTGLPVYRRAPPSGSSNVISRPASRASSAAFSEMMDTPSPPATRFLMDS